MWNQKSTHVDKSLQEIVTPAFWLVCLASAVAGEQNVCDSVCFPFNDSCCREEVMLRKTVKLCTLLLCAVIWILTLASANAQDHPPPGTLIDVGGYRVHLYCIGSGSPAVVIVGAGYSFDWALVQPDVSKFTQVCAYDHSGIAWSDPGPTDSCSLRVSEVHSALKNAKISGPFVLVGHSLGALVARLYAAKYADDVAGMVIVDHAFFLGRPVLPSANSPGGAAPPPPPTAPPKGPSNAPAGGPDPNRDFEKLPSVDYQLHLWANSLPGFSKTMQRNFQMAPECSSDVEAASQNKAAPFSDKPLIVLRTDTTIPGYEDLQKSLLALSSNSKEILAENSGHYIMVDRPDLVISSIRDVVDAAQHHTKLNH
jgi:pimeloyl-ACP methyl ester carboxylesterase